MLHFNSFPCCASSCFLVGGKRGETVRWSCPRVLSTGCPVFAGSADDSKEKFLRADKVRQGFPFLDQFIASSIVAPPKTTYSLVLLLRSPKRGYCCIVSRCAANNRKERVLAMSSKHRLTRSFRTISAILYVVSLLLPCPSWSITLLDAPSRIFRSGIQRIIFVLLICRSNVLDYKCCRYSFLRDSTRK